LIKTEEKGLTTGLLMKDCCNCGMNFSSQKKKPVEKGWQFLFEKFVKILQKYNKNFIQICD
jgi:hypothetical protein